MEDRDGDSGNRAQHLNGCDLLRALLDGDRCRARVGGGPPLPGNMRVGYVRFPPPGPLPQGAGEFRQARALRGRGLGEASALRLRNQNASEVACTTSGKVRTIDSTSSGTSSSTDTRQIASPPGWRGRDGRSRC